MSLHLDGSWQERWIGEEVDVPGKGTKLRLFTILNKVLLPLAPALLQGLMSQETCLVMLNHTGVPSHLLLSHHHTCACVACSS